MKYDLTYNNFLEKRSWFGNSSLIHEHNPTLVNTQKLL